MFARFVIGTICVGVAVGLMMPAPSTPPAAAPPVEPPIVAQAVVKAAPALDQVIQRSDDGHFYVDAEVNGQIVHFLVDTGASSVVLTMADAKHVGLPFSPEQFSVIARGASGDVSGQVMKIGRVAIGRKEAFDVKGAVVGEGLDISLLGQSFLSRIGTVVIDGDRMILR
jgi:aspartyl protease family protein